MNNFAMMSDGSKIKKTCDLSTGLCPMKTENVPGLYVCRPTMYVFFWICMHGTLTRGQRLAAAAMTQHNMRFLALNIRERERERERDIEKEREGEGERERER